MSDERTPVVTEAAVRERLRGIVDPCSESRGIGNDIIDMGLLEDIEVDGDHVTVRMRLTSPACHMVPHFSGEVNERVGAMEGVQSVTFETDTGYDWSPDRMTEEGRARREAYLDTFRAPVDGD